MKIIRVFIFCLLATSIWFLPTVLFAAEKTTVLDLTIQPRDLLAEAMETVKNEEFIELSTEPIILDKIDINGVEVVSTVSGSQETGFILSIF